MLWKDLGYFEGAITAIYVFFGLGRILQGVRLHYMIFRRSWNDFGRLEAEILDFHQVVVEFRGLEAEIFDLP